MNDLTIRVHELQHMAHHLMYLGIDNAPLFSSDFTRANTSVLTESDALFICKGTDAEEEANLCLALIMGYNATIYDAGDKEEKLQAVLNRSFCVLNQLSASLLKVRLLTYCYGEVYDEAVLKEANAIIDGWDKETFSAEQMEIVEELRNMEENGYLVER